MTTDRHDPEPKPELQDEFWGEHTEWTAPRRPPVEHAGFGATIGRWWNGLLGGSVSAEREHGRPRAATTLDAGADTVVERRLDAGDIRPDRVDDEAGDHHERDGDEPGGDERGGDERGGDEGAGDDAWVIEPEPQPVRHLGGDPLLARLGGLAVIITLAAPLVVGFVGARSDSPAADALATTAGVQLAESSGSTTEAAPENAAASTSTDPSTTSSPAVSAASASGPVATAAPDAAPSTAAPDSAAPALLESAPVAESVADADTASAATTVTTPSCGASYELAAGDYWIRIADAADVPLAELLAVNDSSIDTVLVPGRSICLPVGASTPAPPTPVTTTPDTTAPARSAPAAPSTTNRTPATTAAPTTTAPPRPAAVPESQAAAIIRDVWPDDLEERALEIAWRESNHRSNVNNWCCYGLFQIHWEAHRSWLATIGVTSVSQLYDPVVNANAAYTLYQRAGGFGPWGG